MSVADMKEMSDVSDMSDMSDMEATDVSRSGWSENLIAQAKRLDEISDKVAQLCDSGNDSYIGAYMSMIRLVTILISALPVDSKLIKLLEYFCEFNKINIELMKEKLELLKEGKSLIPDKGKSQNKSRREILDDTILELKKEGRWPE
jgi:hypothetical protein